MLLAKDGILCLLPIVVHSSDDEVLGQREVCISVSGYANSEDPVGVILAMSSMLAKVVPRFARVSIACSDEL